MFNRARFNLATFDHEAYTSEIAVRVNFITTGEAMVANGENVGDAPLLYLNGYGRLAGARGIRTLTSVTVSAEQRTVLSVAVTVVGEMEGACEARLKAGEDVHLEADLSALLSHRIYAGKNISVSLQMVGSSGMDVRSGKDISTAALLSTVLDGQITPVRFEIKYTALNITIPPGGVLVIDSDNYNVYLDGNDVIGCHRGEWITICRETKDIVIENPLNATIDATMLYAEKYL